MAESVDARDLKSLTYCRCVSSSLIPSTNQQNNKIMKKLTKEQKEKVEAVVMALIISPVMAFLMWLSLILEG